MGDSTRLGLENVSGLAKHFTIETLRAYLLSRAERTSSGCLEFQGYGTNRRVHQKVSLNAWAHIAAYVAFVGPRDPDLDVSHRCDNPSCIEPTHLLQETHAENMRRRTGRTNRISCEHPRERNQKGNLKRCNPCNAAAVRRWHERQRAEQPVDPLAALFGNWEPFGPWEQETLDLGDSCLSK